MTGRMCSGEAFALLDKGSRKEYVFSSNTTREEKIPLVSSLKRFTTGGSNSRRCTSFFPAGQRTRRLGGAAARKKPFDAYILIEVRPVDSFAVADQLEAFALFRSSSEKPGIPSERNRENPAVIEGNAHSVFGKRDVYRKDIAFNQQSSHSMPP